jgi:hypothetical protein
MQQSVVMCIGVGMSEKLKTYGNSPAHVVEHLRVELGVVLGEGAEVRAALP